MGQTEVWTKEQLNRQLHQVPLQTLCLSVCLSIHSCTMNRSNTEQTYQSHDSFPEHAPHLPLVRRTDGPALNCFELVRMLWTFSNEFFVLQNNYVTLFMKTTYQWFTVNNDLLNSLYLSFWVMTTYTMMFNKQTPFS